MYQNKYFHDVWFTWGTFQQRLKLVERANFGAMDIFRFICVVLWNYVSEILTIWTIKHTYECKSLIFVTHFFPSNFNCFPLIKISYFCFTDLIYWHVWCSIKATVDELYNSCPVLYSTRSPYMMAVLLYPVTRLSVVSKV